MWDPKWIKTHFSFHCSLQIFFAIAGDQTLTWTSTTVCTSSLVSLTLSSWNPQFRYKANQRTQGRERERERSQKKKGIRFRAMADLFAWLLSFFLLVATLAIVLYQVIKSVLFLTISIWSITYTLTYLHTTLLAVLLLHYGFRNLLILYVLCVYCN